MRERRPAEVPPATPRGRATASLLLLAPVLLLGAAGCSSLAHYQVDSAGVPFTDTPPAPYRVAVAPIVIAPSFTRAPEDAGKLHFVYSAHELRDQVIEALNSQNGVSEAFPVSSLDLLEAQDHQADLLLRLTWTDSHFEHEQTIPSRAILSGALWLTTWVGGLFIDDSQYHASVQLRGSLVNPHTGREIRRFPIETRPIELSFWDRNPLLSRSVVESFILPPFWTTDTADETSQQLSADAASQLSSQIVLLFKEGLQVEPPDAVAQIAINSPANDAQLGPVARLRATVASGAENAEPAVFLNGRRVEIEPSAATLDPSGTFAIDTVLQLQPGRNKVQVRITHEGGTLSRTIVLHNPQEASFEDLTPAEEKIQQ